MVLLLSAALVWVVIASVAHCKHKSTVHEPEVQLIWLDNDSVEYHLLESFDHPIKDSDCSLFGEEE